MSGAPSTLVIEASMALARSHGLSSYDASDLELAQRLGASLASFALFAGA